MSQMPLFKKLYGVIYFMLQSLVELRKNQVFLMLQKDNNWSIVEIVAIFLELSQIILLLPKTLLNYNFLEGKN